MKAIKKVKKRPRGYMRYTPWDRNAMSSWVANHPQLPPKGTRIWKDAEQAQITSHSWQSMRNYHKKAAAGAALGSEQMSDESEEAVTADVVAAIAGDPVPAVSPVETPGRSGSEDGGVQSGRRRRLRGSGGAGQRPREEEAEELAAGLTDLLAASRRRWLRKEQGCGGQPGSGLHGRQETGRCARAAGSLSRLVAPPCLEVAGAAPLGGRSGSQVEQNMAALGVKVITEGGKRKDGIARRFIGKQAVAAYEDDWATVSSDGVNTSSRFAAPSEKEGSECKYQAPLVGVGTVEGKPNRRLVGPQEVSPLSELSLLAGKIKQGVVKLTVPRHRQNARAPIFYCAAGFLVEGGAIITAAHSGNRGGLLKGEHVKIMWHPSVGFDLSDAGTVVSSEPKEDWAIVWPHKHAPEECRLELSRRTVARNSFHPLEEVFTFGHPEGTPDWTGSSGRIASIGAASLGKDDHAPVAILVDSASLTFGSSGGPLVDMAGKVIGVVVGITINKSHMVAIPISDHLRASSKLWACS